MGPYPLEPDGRSVRIPVRDGLDWQWARIDADQLRVVLQHRWHVHAGYARTRVRDISRNRMFGLFLHRLVTSAPAGTLVDHRYRNLLDCRRCVLRFATFSQNAANRRSERRNRVAKYRGVTPYPKGRWRAKVQHQGRCIHLGVFHLQEDAAKAYNIAARETWGEYATLNRLGTQVSSSAPASAPEVQP